MTITFNEKYKTSIKEDQSLPLTPAELYGNGGCIFGKYDEKNHKNLIMVKNLKPAEMGCGGGGCVTDLDYTSTHRTITDYTKIISISGKPGAAKNYFSSSLMEDLQKRGYTVAIASFAKPLYTELNLFIDRFHELEDLNSNLINETLSKEFSLSSVEVAKLTALFDRNLIGERNPEWGYNRRNENIRKGLDLLGLDIRRNQNENYWLNKFSHTVPDTDFVIVSDIRFPNEADWVNDHFGVVIRAEINPRWTEANATNEDGFKYSKENLESPLESALDMYENFYATVKYGWWNESEFADHILTEEKLPLTQI